MFETGTATDHADLMEKLHVFLTTNGSAFSLAYAGTGTGALSGLKGGSASVAETFAITATSATNFTVVGSISGALAAATVGTPYTGTKVQFLISAGGAAFIAGDVFTCATAPKWVAQRRCRGCTVLASQPVAGLNNEENLIDGKLAGDAARRYGLTVASFPATLEFTFLAAETIAEYAVMSGSLTAGPKSWVLEYWTGAAWSTLDTQSNVPAWAGSFNTYAIASPVSATRYRLNVSAGQSGSALEIDAVELRRTVGGINAAFSQYVWLAPGNAGTEAIYVGAHHLRRLDVDYYDWELAGFDGYNANAPFYGQPNFHGRVWLPLASSSMPYWFICDGRRAIVVAKVGTQYELAYLGLYDSYFTAAQAPYPLCVAGTVAHGTATPFWNHAGFRWSDPTHRMPTHGNVDASSFGIYHTPLRARGIDGTWLGFIATLLGGAPPSNANVVWPYAGDFSQLDGNLDGSYSLFQIILFAAAPNALGTLSGIRAVTGQGLGPESLITIGPVSHLVLPNINRVGRTDYLAVRLD